jgi:dihydrofolate reductase
VSSTPEIALIAAMDRKRAIGKAGALPWHLPEDLQHFKRLTTGQTVLMGRKTFESIGKALPKRKNLVLTRDPNWRANGAQVVSSLDNALVLSESETLWVIGGGEIYRLAMPTATRLEITHVDTEVIAADTFFPEIPEGFRVSEREQRFAAEFTFAFVRYQR